MTSQISHSATVTAIGQQSVTVRVDGNTGCAGCRVALMCGHSENSIIQVVKVDDPSIFAVGEVVSLTATAASMWKAITIGLIIPCFILLALLLGCLSAGMRTHWALLLAFAVIGLYYVVLACKRSSIETAVRWTVEKQHSSQI